MKKSLLILVIFIVVLFGCTKKNNNENSVSLTNDSLSSYLSLANDDSLTLTKKKEYNQKAFEIIINQENDSINRINLFKIANRYYNMNDWNDYKKTVRLIIKNAEIGKDNINTAKAFTYLGDYYVSQGISDSAFMYYFKAEKMYLKLNDNYNLARTRLSKANLQYGESDFLGGEIAVFNALKVIKGEKANDILYDANNLLGAIYNEIGDYNKAIEFHNKALESIDDKVIPNVFQSKATSLNNIGYVYQNLNEHSKAKKYFQEGLSQKKLKIDKPALYAMLVDNLAYSKFKLKELDSLPEEFIKSLKIRDSLQLTSGVFINKIHLSEFYAYQKDSVKAIQYANEALTTSRKAKNFRNVLAALKQIALVEPKNATRYSKEYIHINDSLQKAERKIGDKFSRIEYETDEIKNENTDLVIQNRNLLYVFGLVLLLTAFTFISITQRAKHRALLFKQEQQKANTEIYNLIISQQTAIESSRLIEKKRVARELHDGVLGRMFGVRINLDSLNQINDQTAFEKRNDYLTELKNIEQDIREISHDLNREKSDLINNFVVLVEDLFEKQKNTYTSKLISNIDASIKWELISNATKINLYRIVQEALQNSNKYAKATTIIIEFKKELDNLVLVISDNGIGYNVKKAKKGIGLQNIIYRTNECNGTVTIISKIGEGTTITVNVPT
ncbi:tetratricopeptide repeat-containing sensor histidine kinase [Flavobacterium restrictum]|uniref:histidine kinase n=1 Tax=Flavobacterium restrictum TaxID=2594428 RepID=A0A553DYC3_9FLAO|nr:tetratricopeptide repeat protein [Flavobacterium restrictum]TRX37736.1 tetratricopeptide repeat protein [Flavobacterium restrictum]